ncbi:MAG: hypothetical protein K6V73_07645 [Firmicutes bacterium]|nr:hypothetical protein [Bacillota bacterium]
MGYEVGESIIYPGLGGYSILANPALKWTIPMKQAYIANHEPQQDLAAFLSSSYAHSPEAALAHRPLFTLHPSGTLRSSKLTPPANISPFVNSCGCSLGSHTFDSGQYFSVGGISEGGFTGDASEVFTDLGDAGGTDLDYPYYYAQWGNLYTYVEDLQTTYPNESVALQVSWTFSGLGVSVSWPPSVSVQGSQYVWQSYDQPTWYYAFTTSQSDFISSSSLLATQTGTQYTYIGTVNINYYGTGEGAAGSHSEGWSGGSINGDYVSG